MNIALFIPTQTALSKDVRTRALPGLQRHRDDLLRMAHSVNSRSVDPVNAKLERAMNRIDRLLIVLVAPTEFPTGSADCPGSKTDRCDEQVRITELFRFHLLNHDIGLH